MANTYTQLYIHNRIFRQRTTTPHPQTAQSRTPQIHHRYRYQ